MDYRKIRKLTPKQKEFVKQVVVKLKTFTAAAEGAGYADPSGEVDRLMANPDVMASIAQLQRAILTTWQQSAVTAKKVIDELMEPLVVAFDEDKEEYVFIGNDPKTRLAAAGKVIDYLSKADPESLFEKAESVDKRDRATVVAEILGRDIPQFTEAEIAAITAGEDPDLPVKPELHTEE